MIGQTVPSVPIERAGRFLRFRYEFVAPTPAEQARQRLQAYFTRLGYAPMASADALVMRRGSLARSMLNWTPRKLAVELTARFAPAAEGTAVEMTLQLNRTGHTIFEAERYLHAWELTQAEAYLRGEPVDFEAMERFEKRTLERSRISLALALAVSVPFGVLSVVLLRPMLTSWGIEGIPRGAILGGLVGGIVGVFMWLFNRKMLNPQNY